MSRNGTPAIILIYLLTTLPSSLDRSSRQLANATSQKINFYSTFKDRLDATSELAKSEYDARTMPFINGVYDLAGKMLFEQLKQHQEENDLKNGNYSGKLADHADPSHNSHEELPAAVAPASEVANNSQELINAQEVVHRQANKTHNEGSKLCHDPHRSKKSYSEEYITRRPSSRSRWANRRMQPTTMPMDAGEKWELPPIRDEQTIKEVANIMDDKWRWGRTNGRKNGLNGNAADAAVGTEINGLAESIDGGSESSQYELPSDKWRTKLQIHGKRRNLQKSRSWPSHWGTQSDGLIESEKEIGNSMHGRRRSAANDDGTITGKRSAEAFPEVYSAPAVDSNPLSNIGLSSSTLTDAIRNANKLLTIGPTNTDVLNADQILHRIGKQTTSVGTNLTLPPPLTIQPSPVGSTDSNLTQVMEKVLGELESIKECNAVDDRPPEGSPCDIVGTWNSEILGLQFHLSIAEPSTSSRSFIEGKELEIDITERVPPRQHDLMDCDWYLTSSTLKQFGGPLYITAQKAEKYMLATFAGLCKTCGGVPTIFGSWTFVNPPKDCQDISLAIENKRDVLRKDNFQAKRKHRLSKLGEKTKSKCVKRSCC